jgi:hypothetical protein
LDFTGKTLTEHAAPYAKMSKQIQGLDGLTIDEAMFLEKPERRFYSVDVANIRSSLIDEVIRTVPPSEIEQRLSRYVHKTIRNT